MFSLASQRGVRLCDGLRRREFMQLGGAAALGISLPGLLAARAAPARGTASFGRAKRCILLFLTGGPPQHDTWDLKPQAADRIRGELKPIDTNVPGVQVSELFPRLAACADKYCIVRSVTHGDHVHTSAGYTMLTGVPHPKANAATAERIRPSVDDHPHFGAILAKARPSRGAVPVFAALPEVIKDAAVNEFPGLNGGFLGSQYAPFLIEANAVRTEFLLPPIFLPPGTTAERLAQRRLLLQQLDERLRRADSTPFLAHDAWQEKAFALLGADGVRRAFALDREPAKLRERYGSHLFGQGCLLARRLVEAGVLLVSVYWHYEGPEDSPVWDTHRNNFSHLRKRLTPPTDQAFSALLLDLADRGLLDETLVICMGEFGRTPHVNNYAGRDHWSGAQSIVLAGAGIRGGTVFGASDRDGAYPADKPVTPVDLVATFLHLLGVPEDFPVRDRSGRTMRACQGSPIRDLL